MENLRRGAGRTDAASPHSSIARVAMPGQTPHNVPAWLRTWWNR
jgi:hypothetical protein